MGHEAPWTGHSENSHYDTGDRVRVVDIYKTYRDKKIIGHTGEVRGIDYCREGGWSYRVKLDDPDAVKLAATEWDPPGKDDELYGQEWFSEDELEPESGVKPGLGSIEGMLKMVDEPHQTECFEFIKTYEDLFNSSKGSAIKHQAWKGGYRDHITEVMRIAVVTYKALSFIRPLPFSLSHVLVGCFLHDVEKIWKHAIDSANKQDIDKNDLIDGHFTMDDDLWNAIHYAHGEGDDYHPTDRIQGPLAAFVHHCDNTSARIWFDKPEQEK